jgi:hypothetical protein
MPGGGGTGGGVSPTSSPHAVADWAASASEAGHSANAPHLASPRKRRERDRHVSTSLGAAGGGNVKQGMAFCGRVEARYVAFVGMFFVTLTAASLYSLLAPFFPSVAGARARGACFCALGGAAGALCRESV